MLNLMKDVSRFLYYFSI